MFNCLCELCPELRDESGNGTKVSNQDETPDGQQKAGVRGDGYYSKKILPPSRDPPGLARSFFGRVFLLQEFRDPCRFV